MVGQIWQHAESGLVALITAEQGGAVLLGGQWLPAKDLAVHGWAPYAPPMPTTPYDGATP